MGTYVPGIYIYTMGTYIPGIYIYTMGTYIYTYLGMYIYLHTRTYTLAVSYIMRYIVYEYICVCMIIRYVS